jgi:hypothetical protein
VAVVLSFAFNAGSNRRADETLPGDYAVESGPGGAGH